MEKSEWFIKVTYNSDNPGKNIVKTYYTHTRVLPNTLENRIWKHYNENYERLR
jgi:hypothetical protein